MLGIVTVDDIIDAHGRGADRGRAAVRRHGGARRAVHARSASSQMIRKRAGWLCALFLGEMLTATAMQRFEGEMEKAVVLALFIPLIMSSGGNSGSQATSLIIRALALREMQARATGGGWRCASCRPARAGRDPGRDRLRADRALAEARLLRLRRALSCWWRSTVGVRAGRHRHLRLARRLDAAVPAASASASIPPAPRRRSSRRWST